MKTKTFILLFLLTSLLSSCQNKNSIKSDTKTECKIFYKKYNQKIISEENDSAIYYIDKAINCNSQNVNYKYYKVQFLVSLKKYKEAIVGLNEIKTDVIDPAIKMENGILKLKINDPSSEKILKECLNDYNLISKPTSSNLFYKIALENYFNGKDKAMIEIQKYKNIYNEPYETQNINALIQSIQKDEKKKVLFDLFSIKD